MYPGTPQAPQPPQPPVGSQRRARRYLPAILSGLGAILIIALLATGLLALSQHGKSTTSAQATVTTAPATATATSLPTVTPFPGNVLFADALPGVCGDHPNQWSTDTFGTRVSCANGVMTLTNPSTDKYVSNEYFQPPNYTFPSRYAVAVTVTNLTGGCGGEYVLGNNAQGYAAYICDGGGWGLYSYDSNGNSQTVDSGFYGVGGTYTLVMAISPGRLDVSINGATLSTTQPTQNVTYYLGLAGYTSVTDTTASADFDHFSLTA